MQNQSPSNSSSSFEASANNQDPQADIPTTESEEYASSMAYAHLGDLTPKTM